MLHNASLLESSPSSKDGSLTHRIKDVESVVLSHGHFDHFQGLAAFFQRVGRKMPLILHPDAFSERRARPNAQQIRPLPSLQKESLEAAGALLDERDRPSTLAEDLILVTGQVERKTDFERGSPGLEARVGDAWIPDPFHDDQGIAIHLRGKGLIVLSGCSHAGIINTVYHVRNATGIERVHAVMGGFHLGGKSESLIEPTIDEMVGINPDIIVPMHCTGWKAIQRFAEVMPDAFVYNSVGTTYLFSN
jgi:7,8-dihydropterin-6-yl-methyl-4-(beta-D-ribofuranosyl)aminobenzene 5'-phosphate synthase